MHFYSSGQIRRQLITKIRYRRLVVRQLGINRDLGTEVEDTE